MQKKRWAVLFELKQTISPWQDYSTEWVFRILRVLFTVAGFPSSFYAHFDNLIEKS